LYNINPANYDLSNFFILCFVALIYKIVNNLDIIIKQIVVVFDLYIFRVYWQCIIQSIARYSDRRILFLLLAFDHN